MNITLPIHILAGSLGLIAGYIALYSTKGAPLHRRAGRVFVYVMLTMTMTGIVIAATRGAAPALNIPAGLLTGYLVFTGFTTVRPLPERLRWLGFGTMLMAFVVGLIVLTFGLEAVGRGGTRNGMPAFPFFMFGAIGVLGAIGDVRMMRSGGLRGAPRITRHLWRMSTALLIAVMSFFIGQADVIPKPIRIMPLLALPMLAVFVTLLYWLWRVRVRRSSRGIVTVGAPEAV